MKLEKLKEFMNSNGVECRSDENGNFVMLINFSELQRFNDDVTGYLELQNDEVIDCKICNGYVGIDLFDLLQNHLSDDEFPEEMTESAFIDCWLKDTIKG